MAIGAKSVGFVEIFFKEVGLAPLTAKTNAAFKGMSGRASYYAGMIQSRMGYAFLGMSAAITAFGVLAVKKFADFDQAMMNTASVTGATTEQMAFLRDTAMELGKIGTASATDVANAMYYLGSAGYSTTEIFKAITPVMKLAVATQSDMSDVARITMQALKAFGKEADEATHFAQVFAAGISSTQLRMEWLGQSFKHVGPVAKEMGMSIEETTAALGMLHDSGIQAGMAGRHLRRILQGTIKDTPQVTQVLEDLTLKQKDLNIQSLGFAKVFENLYTAKAKLSDIFKIFGLRASASAAVLRGGIKDFAEYMQKVSDATKLQAMFDKQMQGLQAQFKRLANTMEVFMMKWSESYVPIVRWFTKVLTELMDRFSDLPKWVHIFTASIAVATAALLAFLGVAMILGGLLTQGKLGIGVLAATITSSIGQALRVLKLFTIGVWTAVASLSRGLRPILFEVNEKMKLHWIHTNNVTKSHTLLSASFLKIGKSFLSILVALVAVYAVTLLLITIWKNFSTTLINAGKAIGRFFINIGKSIKDVVFTIIDWFAKIKLPAWLQKPLDWVAKKWGKGTDAMKAKWEKLTTSLKKDTDAFVEFFKVGWDDLTDSNRILMESLGFTSETFKKMKESLSGIFGPATDEFNDFKETNEENLTLLGEKYESFKDRIVSSWTDTIIELAKGSKTWLDVWNMVCDDALKTFVNSFVKKMVDKWFDALIAMHDAQAAMGSGSFGKFLGILAALGGIFGGGGAAPAGASTGITQTTTSMPFGQTDAPVGLSQYAEGTNYVPDDGLAYLHKGEAVVPSKFNTGGSGGGQTITIVNVVDPSFVQSSIARDPGTVVNIINDDLMMAGSTRKTFRRYLR